MKPKQVKIGHKKYAVQYHTKPWTAHQGDIDEARARIRIALYDCVSKKRRTKSQQMGTFWHELTHGILIDMDHGLWNNERFVTAFASRLHKAIENTELG